MRGQRRMARQTPSGARPNRGTMGWLDPSPGALLEPCREARPRGMVVHDRTRLNDRLRHFLSFQHSSCTTQSKSRIPGDQWLPVSSYLCVRAETSRGTRGTAADIVVPAVSGARISGKDLRLL